MKKRKLVLWYPKPYSKKMMEGMQYPPIGLGIIAALTPPDWDVVIRDANFDSFEVEQCDLVGVSAMTLQALSAYDIARAYREKQIPVVMGGIHATMCPDEASQHVDVVVKGEAETVWPELIADFEKGSLKKIYEQKITDSNGSMLSPIPAVHLFNPKYQWGLVQTTRGCPFKCEYCSVHVFHDGKYRKRPIEDVLDELEKIPQKVVFFADDNLAGYSKEDHERFIALAQGIIRRGIKKSWFCQVSVHFSDNEEMMRVAKAAGCGVVILGIESGSREVLTGHMAKSFNVKYLERGDFVKKIHRHGITVMGSFIVGSDEDGVECFENTYDTIRKLKIDMPLVTPLIPHPGTKLFKRLMQEDRLLRKDFPHDWQYFHEAESPLYTLRKMSSEDLQKGFRKLCKKIYSLPAILYYSVRSFWYSRDFTSFLNVLLINLAWRRDRIHLLQPKS